MRRFLGLIPVLSVLALSACAPPVPESGPPIGGGVGFNNYVDYQLARTTAPSAARVGPSVSPPAPVPTAPRSDSQAIANDALAAIGVLPPGGPAPSAPTVSAPATPLPLPAAGSSGPNIVAFALATTHPVGQKMYRRSALGAGRFERSCSRFTSDGMAQEEFLRRGGPERDPMGVDPDGDGYACRWDPSPFRLRGS